MSVNQRLKDYCDIRNVKQKDIALVARVKDPTVSGWFTKAEPISDKVIIRIIRHYKDINARWLITGEGSMLDEQLSAVQEAHETYGAGRNSELKEAWKEVGRLEERVKQLEKELLLFSDGGPRREPGGSGARAG